MPISTNISYHETIDVLWRCTEFCVPPPREWVLLVCVKPVRHIHSCGFRVYALSPRMSSVRVCQVCASHPFMWVPHVCPLPANEFWSCVSSLCVTSIRVGSACMPPPREWVLLVCVKSVRHIHSCRFRMYAPLPCVNTSYVSNSYATHLQWMHVQHVIHVVLSLMDFQSQVCFVWESLFPLLYLRHPVDVV